MVLLYVAGQGFLPCVFHFKIRGYSGMFTALIRHGIQLSLIGASHIAKPFLSGDRNYTTPQGSGCVIQNNNEISTTTFKVSDFHIKVDKFTEKSGFSNLKFDRFFF